jgi:DNA-binding transcriptional regulator YhcF (GntR family)
MNASAIRADQIAAGVPWEQKSVHHHWFHVVREMVQSGEIARVGTVPWAVYCVVKSHTGFETGNAFPSTARIADLVGVSHHTVFRALKKLVEAGLISADKKRGRGSVYSVIEKIPMSDLNGEPWATAETKYIPLQFSNLIAEIQRMGLTGNMPTNAAIHINLVVQNVYGNPGVVNAVGYGDRPDQAPA